MLAVLPTGTTKEIYVYKWHYSDNTKVQTSWSKFTFDGDVLAMSFNNTDLYLLIRYDDDSDDTTDTSYLEKIELADSTKPLLDRLRYFDSSTGLSDYRTALGSDNVMVDASTNEIVADIPSDLSATPIYVGIPYTFKYEISEQVYKDNNLDVAQARFQLRKILIDFANTNTFDVDVTPTARGTTTYNFTSAQQESGSFTVPIQSQASEVSIEIKNSSHFPCTITGAEWEAYIHLRSKRL